MGLPETSVHQQNECGREILTDLFLFRRTFEYRTSSTPLLAFGIRGLFLWTASGVNGIGGRDSYLLFPTLDAAGSGFAFGMFMCTF